MSDISKSTIGAWCNRESSTENGAFVSLCPNYGDNDFRKAMVPPIEGTPITTVDQANETHERIKNCLKDAIGLGKFLVEQKEKAGHSNWENWVKDNLEFTSRQASRYIRLYNERSQLAVEQIRHGLSDLSMTKALKILASDKKAKIVTKKATTKVASITQHEGSNGAYSMAYQKFANAIAVLKSLDADDHRYPQWIEILEDVISDMKSKASASHQEAA